MKIDKLCTLFYQAKELSRELVGKSEDKIFNKDKKYNWPIHAKWWDYDNEKFFSECMQELGNEKILLERLCKDYIKISQSAIKGEIKLKIENVESEKKFTHLILADNLEGLTSLCIPTYSFAKKHIVWGFDEKESPSVNDESLKENSIVDHWSKGSMGVWFEDSGCPDTPDRIYIYSPSAYLKNKKVHIYLNGDVGIENEINKFKSTLINRYIPILSPLIFKINKIVSTGESNFEKKESDKRNNILKKEKKDYLNNLKGKDI
ncbi:MAG: hypothetical protein PHH54_02275 [Candidatus Nanoarchaeia archaeon]|nr:hypothetical protein [Candidatus Nanoarchaeia archaeon]MDD5740788.1 hypothetical protein [Candidatus Nanoarchaeia archaeon]